jgi:hypothetical protein
MNNNANMPFTQRDGLKYIMQNKQHSHEPEQFPDNGIEDHVTLFKRFEDHLNKNVHPMVNLGAALHGDGLLNDHGPDHVQMVMKRASRILGERACELTGYELFLLLIAIHLHDTGIIFGREEHEQKIYEIVQAIKAWLPFDNATIASIVKIATAHGGYYNGSKDTISHLQFEDYLCGDKYRPTLLAAILRFSDEIADDNTRTSRFLDSLGAIPQENQAYHDYSNSLHPAGIDNNTLILHYDIAYDLTQNKTTKAEKANGEEKIVNVFLYDEILSRLHKCFTELEYCQKFSCGLIKINSINAIIEVFKQSVPGSIYKDSLVLNIGSYPSGIDFSKYYRKKPKSANGNELKSNVPSSK